MIGPALGATIGVAIVNGFEVTERRGERIRPVMEINVDEEIKWI